MMRMILPGTDRRAHLRAFWLTLTVGLGVAVALILGWAHVRHPWTGAGVCAALFALIPWANEASAWRVYRGWNRFLARPVARIAQRLVLRLGFFVIRVAALGGRPGLGASAGGEGGGGWSARTSLGREGYEELFFGARLGSSGSAGWKEQYRRWAAHSGHVWAIALLPFFAVLRWVDPEEEKAAAANIYTLF